MWRVLIVSIVVAFAASLASDVRADVIQAGKVSVCADGSISIIAKNGDNKQFDVADDAKITLNGKVAKLTDIEVGDAVKLTVKERQGKQVAVVIEARDAE